MLEKEPRQARPRHSKVGAIGTLLFFSVAGIGALMCDTTVDPQGNNADAIACGEALPAVSTVISEPSLPAPCKRFARVYYAHAERDPNNDRVASWPSGPEVAVQRHWDESDIRYQKLVYGGGVVVLSLLVAGMVATAVSNPIDPHKPPRQVPG